MNATIDVLIVEDSPTQAQQLQHALESAGYRTALAKNGREGLALLKERKARVVLSDINMPEMDGYEFCKKIKACPDLKDIPVILLTSLMDAKDIIHGLECGASNFVTKPFDNSYLISRIKHLFANEEMRGKRNSQIVFEFLFAGKQYRLDADRMQILDLLLSTYETAVQKNAELIRVQKELKHLNESLEAQVRERTAAVTTINEELRAEIAARKQSEQLYHALFESSVDGVAIVDVETRALRHVNPAMCRILGYTEAELKTLRVDDLHPKDVLPHVIAQFEAVAREGKTSAPNVLCLRKDGAIVHSDISANTLAIDGRACVVGMFRDVTERNHLQQQLLQAQKMESIGRLAGGVAHDFNNILTAVSGYSHFLLNALSPEDPKRSDVEEIKKAGERAASLTRQLLAFSRQQVLQPKVLDLNAIVRDIEKMLRRIIGENMDLLSFLSEDLGRISADPGQVEQVILNLVINARDAMPQGGKITIETKNVDLSEDYSRTHLDCRPGPHVMLAVSDTGTGMDAETLSHLFEPFFTTKEQGKGTGLGLSTIYGIIKQSGGSVFVYSEPGHGSVFKIYLPRVSEEAVKPTAAAEPAPVVSRRGSETILLIEDDEIVRKFVSRLLSQNGYALLEAHNPKEAMQICENHAGRIHLLLTDIVMPDMRGDELAKRLCARRPDMKVIFTSGYTETGVIRHDLLGPNVLFVQKPIDPALLTDKVREILDAV